MKKIISILIALTALEAYGQITSDASKDTIPAYGTIDSVTITSIAIDVKLQAYSQQLLKVNPNQSFTELLQKQSGIFIKSTGVGALSTPSYKGLGTQNIPVSINGYNIQSSMNGTMDLSLIDAVHFNSARFSEQFNRRTGHSNMGSVVQLMSGDFEPGASMNLGGSSLQEKNLSFAYRQKFKKLKYSISAAGTQSPNSFSLKHYDRTGSIENNDFKRISVVQNFNRAGNKIDYISSTLYFQAAERGIPSSLTTTDDGRQFDMNAMLGTKLLKINRLGLFSFTNQLWHEKIDYSSKSSNLNAYSDVSNVNSVLSYSRSIIGNLDLSTGLGNENAIYISNNIENNVNWFRLRYYYDLSRRWNKSTVYFGQQFTSFNHKSVFNTKLYFDRVVKKNTLIKLFAQKVYRLPTLNELYWFEPGLAMGNPDLIPEEGYRLDVKFIHNSKKYMVRLNPYLGQYSNMIVWQGILPVQVENVTNVHVRGVEWVNMFNLKVLGGDFVINNNIHWVQSLNRSGDRQYATWNKQLIFTPELTSNLTLSYTRKKFNVYTNVQYVGKNFYASDNSGFLDPYYLLEFGGYYETKLMRIGCIASNLTNQAYFSVPNMPQPGRFIKLNITKNFKLKNAKKN